MSTQRILGSQNVQLHYMPTKPHIPRRATKQYSIGVEASSGEIVKIKLSALAAHHLWDFLNTTAAAQPCAECKGGR